MTDAVFHKPDTLNQALAILAEIPDAQCVSGGATLVAMMNADLIEPTALISLSGIGELRTTERLADGDIRIGAMRRHRETAYETDFADGQKVVAEAASKIANPPVRNMGTIGGSISFSDPAADYPPALVAAGAIVEVASMRGRREIAAADFFVDWYETALEPGEIVAGIRIPAAPPSSIGIYNKLARVAGDFAIVSVALVVAIDKGVCASIAVALGGCGPKPVRLVGEEAALIGGGLDTAAVEIFGARLAESMDPVDDVRSTADYRRTVGPRMIVQAVQQAATLAGEHQ